MFKRRSLFLNLSALRNRQSASSIKAMALSGEKKIIACCQITATPNKEKNREVCASLIANAAKGGSKVIFLPELFDYVAASTEETIEMAEPLDGLTIKYYQELSKKYNVWLSLGGFHHKRQENSATKLFNTHVMLDNQGKIVETYDKIHLFSVNIKDGPLIHESEHTTPGNRIKMPVQTPVGKLGLNICYDLRFAEESLLQTQMGAEILVYPCAFTVTTGMAHWEVLLRARAIENQCYVVAAAQTGEHYPNRKSYGHSMIIDPWGTVIAQVSEGTGFCMAEVNLEYLQEVRSSLQVAKHRRHDVYEISLKERRRSHADDGA